MHRFQWFEFRRTHVIKRTLVIGLSGSLKIKEDARREADLFEIAINFNFYLNALTAVLYFLSHLYGAKGSVATAIYFLSRWLDIRNISKVW